jgi:hypothetical protein
MDHILRTADWWCLPILSSFTYSNSRLLCLRGSPCNLSESIPEEYQAAPQLAVCSHICYFDHKSPRPLRVNKMVAHSQDYELPSVSWHFLPYGLGY